MVLKRDTQGHELNRDNQSKFTRNIQGIKRPVYSNISNYYQYVWYMYYADFVPYSHT